MVIHENELTVQQFCDLQESVGFGRPNENQMEIALKNSLYRISIEEDKKIIGMGRIIGDGARVFYLQDIFINSDYQRRGIGTVIVKKLLSHIENIAVRDCDIMICIMASKGKEDFYKKFNFRVRPNEHEGSGMMMNIRK